MPFVALSSKASLLLLTLLGVALFSRGFFPVKPLLAGYAESEFAEEPPFSRLVFILVDALRSDFAFGPESHMSFVHSIVDSGHALPFTAIAQAPTVTLPRLKALTTGSNPTFLDAILNIAEDSSSAVLENVDSWVRQLAMGPRQKRIVFAGDDTWLRIFPQKWFTWSEGVSSFFVSDTQTVDTNVTRHLDHLLEPSSPSPFDVLILHYLGLDHVGHLGGPESRLMRPKQVEMDAVVERTFRYLQQQDQLDGERSLLVLVGDHGMTEAGNHGGSTEGETSAALLIAAPSHPPITPPPAPRYLTPYRHHQVVNQIDLVPTLSLLLGIGIPTNSMGKVIQSVMTAYSASSVARALKVNLEQIKPVLEASSPGALAELTREMSRSFAETGIEHPSAEDEMSTLLTLAQERLMATFGDYHLVPMALGLALLGVLVFFSGGLARATWVKERATVKRAVGGALLVYFATSFATSFIEEEHEGWFFASTTLLLLLALRPSISARNRAAHVAAAASVRLMRSWSHNGQKDVPNVSLSSHLATSPTLLAVLNATTYLFLASIPIHTLYTSARSLSRRSCTTSAAPSDVKQLFTRALTFAGLLVVSLLQVGLLAALKMVTESPEGVWARWLAPTGMGGPTELARAGCLLGALGWVVARGAKVVDPLAREAYEGVQLASLTTLLASLTRPSNLFLFVLLWGQYFVLRQVRMALSPLLFSSTVIALQHVSFFAFGGSNSLATIDLSQAYNGITTYYLPLVSLQTFLSNFSGPIFFALAVPSLLSTSTSSSNPTPTRTTHFLYTTSFHSLSFLALTASATHFRRHLFVWTVFSPALLYKGVWGLLVHWVMGVGVASLQ